MELTPQQWMTEPLKKYAQFDGRAQRSEYWWFLLLNIIVSIVASLIDRVLGMGHGGFGLFGGLCALALLIPGLAVGFRRLHDIDRSAWWILIGLIPFVGFIVVLYWACQEGTAGPNQFGPDPKGR